MKTQKGKKEMQKQNHADQPKDLDSVSSRCSTLRVLADRFLNAGNKTDHWDAAVAVVAAWRHENPDDDEQIISQVWLESVGFTKRSGPGWKSTHFKRSIAGELSVCSQFGNVWWNQEHIRFCRTRGEVRRLVSAMGLDA
ncbi:hypothetical protein RSSM_04013 [Rhodopirellula sallentina SM41]|uniref:Uncharacterized protein n=1 Tax=Rhodopirellula sallentina SM41 TaxID=1263870 RepID=M5TZA2_9BACT|nr:hypothetical protein RSSM_04013 [Rhodopirellula sallentina SM41]